MFHDTDLNLWVTDVASGVSKKVGQRSVDGPHAHDESRRGRPTEKWIAYAKHLNSLYHVIQVVNVETGETKQVTDGLSDAVSPAWDASGKYLWFLASTDYALKSQWLDMTNYPFTETFGLYFAVLKKGDASPLLPESDEETGIPAGGGRGGRGGGAGG
jgi:tricorn protease